MISGNVFLLVQFVKIALIKIVLARLSSCGVANMGKRASSSATSVAGKKKGEKNARLLRKKPGALCATISKHGMIQQAGSKHAASFSFRLTVGHGGP